MPNDLASPLSHSVYFTLSDPREENVQTLISDCKEYLEGHAGVRFFAVGRLCNELDRPVNDLDFHVSLQVVFDNKAAHDTYQTSPQHQAFIEKNKPTWSKIRVFDSLLA